MLHTSDLTGIPSGTYRFDEMSGNALTYDDGILLINFNFDDMTGSYYEIDGGSLVVVRTGAIYEFTFTGSASDDQSNSKPVSLYMKSTPMFLMEDAKSKLFLR